MSALLLASLLVSAPVSARPSDFEGLACGGDLAPQLIGRKQSDEPAAAIVKASPALKLECLGGDELDNGFFESIWSICGDRYLLLLSRGTVADAVRLPALHDQQLPVSVECTRDGKPVGGVLPVLAKDAKEGQPNVQVAWRIDFKKKKLVPLETAALVCPVNS